MTYDFKIDVREVIKEHLRTLVNDRTGRADISDWLSFFFLPLVCSTILVAYNIYFTTDFIDITVSGLSIFVGLLFNIIVILFDIVRQSKVSQERIALVRETISNISFCILISIMGILVSYATRICPPESLLNKICHQIAYFILIEFIVTLLMVLKRMRSIFVREIMDIEGALDIEQKEGNPQVFELNTILAIIFYLIALLYLVAF